MHMHVMKDDLLQSKLDQSAIKIDGIAISQNCQKFSVDDEGTLRYEEHERDIDQLTEKDQKLIPGVMSYIGKDKALKYLQYS